jgi:hypothetical protein
MVNHHVSYKQNRTFPLTQSEHFQRHFGYSKCELCKLKGLHKRYFAPVNPKTGKGYNDVFVNIKTGQSNHPWPRTGRWMLICKDCHPLAIGLRIASENMRGFPLD